MNKIHSVIDIPLIDNDNSRQFAILSMEEKDKYLCLVNEIKRQEIEYNNKTIKDFYDKKLKTQEKNFKNHITDLEQQIEHLAKKCTTIDHINKENIKDLKLSHKNTIEDLKQSYRTQIEATFETKNARITDLEEKIDQQACQFNQRLIDNANEWNAKIETMRKNYDEKHSIINDLQRKLIDAENLLKLQKSREENNSTIKGAVGEDWFLTKLNKLFPKRCIHETGKIAHRGDYYIDFPGARIMYESKNFSENVPKRDITKFINDVVNNEDYSGGIFMSLKSGIARKSDFTLEFENCKPVIYLYNVNDNPYHIKIASDILLHILQCSVSSQNIKSNELIREISEIVNGLILEKNEHRKILNRLNQSFEKISNSLDKVLKVKCREFVNLHKNNDKCVKAKTKKTKQSSKPSNVDKLKKDVKEEANKKIKKKSVLKKQKTTNDAFGSQ